MNSPMSSYSAPVRQPFPVKGQEIRNALKDTWTPSPPLVSARGARVAAEDTDTSRWDCVLKKLLYVNRGKAKSVTPPELKEWLSMNQSTALKMQDPLIHDHGITL